MARVRAAKFEERMTLVEHLGELRGRIVISLVAFGVGFALCFWQDALMLDIANSALPDDIEPVTLSPTEPFFTTVEVSAYGALVLSLPVILWQVYAFVLPAFSDAEKRTLVPFLAAIPILFLAGVAFGYFVVMPAALQFLLNFNTSEFQIEVRAGDYYSFFGIMLLALGILFQVPVGVLSVSRLGIVTPEQLSASRRYAIFVIAVVAAALPGGDPVSMLLIMAPLLVLYEGSIRLSKRFGKPPEERAPAAPAATEEPR